MERSARSEVLGLAKSSTNLRAPWSTGATPPTPRIVRSCRSAWSRRVRSSRRGSRWRSGARGRRLHAARRRQLLCSRARAGQSCPQAVRIVRHRIAAPGHVLVGANERKIAVVEIARHFSTLWPSASTPRAASTASRGCPTAVNQRPPFEQGGGTCSARMAPPPLTTKHPLMRSRCLWLNRE
jgi:hypothetical protein